MILISSVGFFACKKDSNPSTQTTSVSHPVTIIDSDYTAAIDDATATFIINDAKVIADGCLKGHDIDGPLKHGKSPLSGCEVITWAADTAMGDTCYINFGSSDCVCNDGIKRRGEIIFYWRKSSGTYSQAYFDSANTITMTFKNYCLNDINVSGVRTVANLSSNVSGFQNYAMTANVVLTYPTGHTATWSANHSATTVLVNGVYYYEITGSASGIDHDDVTYSRTITSPLYLTAQPWYLGGCPWIESGIAIIDRSNSTNTLTLNYGSIGTCDNITTANINGNNYTVSMP